MDTPGERGGDLRRTGRWRALTLLAATLVLAMSTWFSASAVIPQLRVQWNLSDSAASLTIAVQLGFVFGALISSLVNLSDMISPRHVILGERSGLRPSMGCW
jgi:nitrate/nitrite transporter NarK